MGCMWTKRERLSGSMTFSSFFLFYNLFLVVTALCHVSLDNLGGLSCVHHTTPHHAPIISSSMKINSVMAFSSAAAGY